MSNMEDFKRPLPCDLVTLSLLHLHRQRIILRMPTWPPCQPVILSNQPQSLLNTCCTQCRARGIFNVRIKPAHHLVEGVLNRLAGLVAMRLGWQRDKPRGAAVATNGLVHAFALDWKSPG